jgi:hypothetical protein
MRLFPRRRPAAALTPVARLQRELADEHDLNIRLARDLRAEINRAEVAEQELDRFRQGIRGAHSALVADNANLRRELAALRTDRNGLRQQLDNALGYSDHELATIEAGKTTAAAA